MHAVEKVLDLMNLNILGIKTFNEHSFCFDFFFFITERFNNIHIVQQ